MENLELLTTLAGGLAAALLMGYLAHWLRVSPLVGYLLAGVLIGPYTPGFVANEHLADQLAEVGVILLMFGVGLQFDIKELLQVRTKVLPGAFIQMFLTTVLGISAGLGFGWSISTAIFFGLTISFASTVVLTRVLSDANHLHTMTGHIGLGWLIVQDIIAVVELVLLPSVFSGEEVSWWALARIAALAILKISAVIAGMVLIGGRLIPGLLRYVALTRSRELFTLTVLVLAIGIAVLSANLFGVSLALGAFLSGMVVARSDFSVRAATEALPMRDAFAVLFFVSVGMLLDPRFILEHPGFVLWTLGIVLIGTPTIVLACGIWRRLPLRVCIGLALALAQIGEFSFILATLGLSLKVFNEDAVNTVIAVAIISISLNPLLYRLARPLSDWCLANPNSWLGRRERALQSSSNEPLSDASEQLNHAVVIGYGPVGQTMSNLLRRNSIIPTIIEMNLDTFESLRAAGQPAVYGDATHADTLVKAGIKAAQTLILSASSTERGIHIVQTAKELNPELNIFVRVPYLRERSQYLKAGAREVYADEGEMAMAMTEAILTGLGATLEQIDRERADLRTSFFGDPKTV
jgi:monovalent cation:H+ antiporter-2, CPA2 family